MIHTTEGNDKEENTLILTKESISVDSIENDGKYSIQLKSTDMTQMRYMKRELYR